MSSKKFKSFGNFFGNLHLPLCLSSSLFQHKLEAEIRKRGIFAFCVTQAAKFIKKDLKIIVI
jgi:hypothetical protein